ncbi:MAG: ferredoxin [Candidatus Woesearchaeota archaeon]
MTTYKIVYNPNTCIGAGECAVVSKMWHVNSKGKAELASGHENVSTKLIERELIESELIEAKRAAGSCPVNAIKIVQC